MTLLFTLSSLSAQDILRNSKLREWYLKLTPDMLSKDAELKEFYDRLTQIYTQNKIKPAPEKIGLAGTSGEVHSDHIAGTLGGVVL